MPLNDIPAHTHANGTRNSAIHDRVDAPTRNPQGNCSNQTPLGGALRSGPAVAESPTISENENVFPQLRQSARSVETFTSSIAIVDRHDGQATFMSWQHVICSRQGQLRNASAHFGRTADNPELMCTAFEVLELYLERPRQVGHGVIGAFGALRIQRLEGSRPSREPMGFVCG